MTTSEFVPEIRIRDTPESTVIGAKPALRTVDLAHLGNLGITPVVEGGAEGGMTVYSCGTRSDVAHHIVGQLVEYLTTPEGIPPVVLGGFRTDAWTPKLQTATQ